MVFLHTNFKTKDMKNYSSLILKVLLLSIFIFTSNASIHAQSKIKGNRDVKTEQSNVTAFKTISIANEFEVVFVKSAYHSVTIEADSNLHSAINFQVSDSVLNFQVTKNIRRYKELKVIIRYTDVLKTVVLGGDVDAEAENTIELPELNLILNDDAKINASILSDKFSYQNNNDSSLKLFTTSDLKVESKSAHIDLKESSNSDLEINTEELHVTMHDNAILNVEGFAYNMELSTTGTSSFNGKDLLTNKTKILSSEKSNIKINVTESVNIDASGSSKIELYGESKITIDQMLNKATLQKNEL